MNVKTKKVKELNTLKLYLITELKHEVFPLPENLKLKGINRHRWHKLLSNDVKMTAKELLLISKYYGVQPEKIMDI